MLLFALPPLFRLSSSSSSSAVSLVFSFSCQLTRKHHCYWTHLKTFLHLHYLFGSSPQAFLPQRFDVSPIFIDNEIVSSLPLFPSKHSLLQLLAFKNCKVALICLIVITSVTLLCENLINLHALFLFSMSRPHAKMKIFHCPHTAQFVIPYHQGHSSVLRQLLTLLATVPAESS